MGISVRFTLNGRKVETEVMPCETALYLLRERFGLKSIKGGCGVGECGACTIVVDGKAVNSCLFLGAQLDGRDVVTIEGLATPLGLHPLQESFIENGAVQCGFCTAGVLMSSYALLLHNPAPRRDEIVKALSGNLCRCTGYGQIIAAVEDAARRMRDGRVQR